MTRRVSLLAMGGTISGVRGASGASPTLGAADLAGGVSGRLADVQLRARDVARTSSRAIGPIEMYDLAEAVRAEIAGGADAVVVTHGTDTLEETAYALALLVDTSVPVVLTGAMRLADAPGADGPANLAAALAAASCPDVAAYGPVVVHQDEVHAARWVTKLYSTRAAAFASPAAGPVGIVVEDDVVLEVGPAPYTDRLSVVAPPSKRIELLWVAAGADAFVVDAIAGRVDGLVIAGTGAGHVPPALADALVRLAHNGLPVVLASRCAGGHVLRATYGGVGSETHLLGEGLVSAGALSPLKARLRLLFGLSSGIAVAELFPSPTASRSTWS